MKGCLVGIVLRVVLVVAAFAIGLAGIRYVMGQTTSPARSWVCTPAPTLCERP